jgi:PIN domain nuclease of toxin-antitoxin system
MRYLLDTHAFLWWCLGAEELSARARAIIADGRNEIYFSAASAWEIAIKTGKGRLSLPEEPGHYVASRMHLHRFLALPVQISHALRVYDLPPHHADPFDRLLIAQCLMESLPLITKDAEIKKYKLEIVW